MSLHPLHRWEAARRALGQQMVLPRSRVEEIIQATPDPTQLPDKYLQVLTDEVLGPAQLSAAQARKLPRIEREALVAETASGRVRFTYNPAADVFTAWVDKLDLRNASDVVVLVLAMRPEVTVDEAMARYVLALLFAGGLTQQEVAEYSKLPEDEVRAYMGIIMQVGSCAPASVNFNAFEGVCRRAHLALTAQS